MLNKILVQMLIYINMIMLFASAPVLAANDLDKDKQFLLGPVQSVRTVVVSDPNRIPVVTTRLYRRDGTIASMEIEWETKSIIYYDSSGRSIKTEKIGADGKKTVDSTVYDDVNHTYVTYYQQAGYPREVRGSLDKNGKIIDYYKYGLDGTYEGKTISTYDDAGLVTETNYYNKTDRHFLKVLYEYDERGLCIVQTAYRENGSVSRRTESEYDQHGRCVESRRYESEVVSPAECILKSQTQVSFDGEDRQTGTRSFDWGAWGETSTIITYGDFDRYGNWRRGMLKYEYPNGHIKKEGPLQTRIIEYY